MIPSKKKPKDIFEAPVPLFSRKNSNDKRLEEEEKSISLPNFH